MSLPDLLAAAESPRALAEINSWLETQTAQQRIAWAVQTLPGQFAQSSSFGAQSATMLKLVSDVDSRIPVVLVDTGYLFPETYQFIDELREILPIKLRTFRSELSPAWLEARHGRLWEQGLEGIQAYNRIVKVEPMRRALDELQVRTWFAGLRRSQSQSRKNLDVLSLQEGRWKVAPIVDWSDRDIGVFLSEHELPYHPLWQQGYVSIGDVHTTRPLGADSDAEQTRFFGLKRECGLHGLDG